MENFGHKLLAYTKYYWNSTLNSFLKSGGRKLPGIRGKQTDEQAETFILYLGMHHRFLP